MQLSKKCYAYGERDLEKYSRLELTTLLEVLDEMGIDINEYFLSPEHMQNFNQRPDSEKLRQIKAILISKYNADIRKQIALKLAKQMQEDENGNFYVEGILKELDRLLNSICFCLLGDESIERYLASDSEDYNFFEKILKLFGFENQKELDKIKAKGDYGLQIEEQKNEKSKAPAKTKANTLEL